MKKLSSIIIVRCLVLHTKTICIDFEHLEHHQHGLGETMSLFLSAITRGLIMVWESHIQSKMLSPFALQVSNQFTPLKAEWKFAVSVARSIHMKSNCDWTSVWNNEAWRQINRENPMLRKPQSVEIIESGWSVFTTAQIHSLRRFLITNYISAAYPPKLEKRKKFALYWHPLLTRFQCVFHS